MTVKELSKGNQPKMAKETVDSHVTVGLNYSYSWIWFVRNFYIRGKINFLFKVPILISFTFLFVFSVTF